MNQALLPRKILLGSAVALLALTASCSRDENQRTVGQQVDSAIAKVERKGEEVKGELKDRLNEARSATGQVGEGLRARAANAGEIISDKVQDAGITAAVNAEFAKDATLSALKIDVDTIGRRVSLHGSAPDSKARERATQLAAGVKGVIAVENRLETRS